MKNAKRPSKKGEKRNTAASIAADSSGARRKGDENYSGTFLRIVT